MTKEVLDGLSKVCNVNCDVFAGTQLPLPAEMGGLCVSSATLSFKKALEKWLSLTNQQASYFDGSQKNWTQLFYVKAAQDLISR